MKGRGGLIVGRGVPTQIQSRGIRAPSTGYGVPTFGTRVPTGSIIKTTAYRFSRFVRGILPGPRS